MALRQPEPPQNGHQKHKKYGKNHFFTHKNANISKNKCPILKNSTAIEFSLNFAYNTRFLKKSVQNCGKSYFFETPPLIVLQNLIPELTSQNDARIAQIHHR